MKVVLITGANRGVGFGFVQHYLAQGWRVIGTARNVGAFPELGEHFIPMQLDVSDEGTIASFAQEVAQLGLTLDLLINNAGISIEENFGDWTSGQFEQNFKVNTIGPALVSQALVSLMDEGAKIVSLSSGMASMELNINPMMGLDAYAASKAALNMVVLRMAEKLKDRKIIAVSMSPGWVQTEMGGPDATDTVEDAISKLSTAIEGLTMEQSGAFLAEDGGVLPW